VTSKKLLLLIFLTVLVFVGLVGYGDFRAVGRQLASFPISYLVAALSLASLNYVLRYVRWVYYLKTLKIDVTWRTSLLVFLAGLALSLTPGKVGELVKSYLLRRRAGIAISASAPVVVMERMTDVIAVLLVGLTGLFLLPPSLRWAMLVILVLCVVGTLAMASRYSQYLLDLPLLRRWKTELVASQEGLRTLLAPRALVVAIGLGGLAWLSEGVAFWLILRGVEADLDLLKAVPIYMASTIVGGITSLPGGLVGTEGAMVALLQQAEVGRAAASASTLLVRLATLWFGVMVGLVALAWLQQSRSERVALPHQTGKIGASAPRPAVVPEKDQPLG
jgi:glycosyltransferase 2 family protein